MVINEGANISEDPNWLNKLMNNFDNNMLSCMQQTIQENKTFVRHNYNPNSGWLEKLVENSEEEVNNPKKKKT